MNARKSALAIALISLLAWSLCACTPPESSPAGMRSGKDFVTTLAPTRTLRQAEYLEAFEVVWGTVDQTFFDPEFGGTDWEAVRAEYEPPILAAKEDGTFYQLLNQMLWELNVSHTGVGPADEWPSVEPAVWEKGEIGVDVRLLDDQAVITRVKDRSPAREAGLRPGFIIQNIETNSVQEIITEAEQHLAPPYTDRGRIDIVTRRLLSMIYGDPGTCVSLTYLDAQDESRESCIKRIQRPRLGYMTGIPLPPARLEFESRTLEGGIGYLSFNTFHPDLIPDMIAAVTELKDAPGIIIDLRGNPGGDPSTAEALAAQFLEGQTSLGSFRVRSGTVARPLTGENVYQGIVVVLIDGLSYSASEYFSAGMQALGRAVILGESSPGGGTGMNVTTLPNGALLGYPVAQLLTPEGMVVEGSGVTPDIAVTLSRDQLLAGIDAQLQAAIDTITKIAQ